MTYSGHVQNGVIVLDGIISLPEGTRVRIEPVVATSETGAKVTDTAWEAALQAAHDLESYDLDAWRKQREYDLLHAADHLP